MCVCVYAFQMFTLMLNGIHVIRTNGDQAICCSGRSLMFSTRVHVLLGMVWFHFVSIIGVNYDCSRLGIVNCTFVLWIFCGIFLFFS
uniref:Uncharacterized protein n=1 Tax=Anopheles darlingi TaxID=43151 RepID=A0A2M4DHL6_ANODA